MSSFTHSTLRCRCGVDVPVDVAYALNVSARPDLRAAILDGTFHCFSCPGCGASMIIDTLLPYTDFPRRHWFTVAPSKGFAERAAWLRVAHDNFRATMVENAAPIAREMGREMTRRLVFGLAALREKLVIVDAGLDDRLIELLKIQLLRDLGLPLELDGYFHVVGVEPETLWMARSRGPGGITEMPVPRDMYDRLAGMGDAARAIFPPFYDDILVDYRLVFTDRAQVAGGPDEQTGAPSGNPALGETP